MSVSTSPRSGVSVRAMAKVDYLKIWRLLDPDEQAGTLNARETGDAPPEVLDKLARVAPDGVVATEPGRFVGEPPRTLSPGFRTWLKATFRLRPYEWYGRLGEASRERFASAANLDELPVDMQIALDAAVLSEPTHTGTPASLVYTRAFLAYACAGAKPRRRQ